MPKCLKGPSLHKKKQEMAKVDMPFCQFPSFLTSIHKLFMGEKHRNLKSIARYMN